MLALTRKADYAMVALSHLVYRNPVRTSAREIARTTGVPLPVLTNILHQLAHHGLVSSTMGSKGGYSLARSAKDITLAEIIEAIEGPVRLTICSRAPRPHSRDRRCELEDNCNIKGPVRRVHRTLQRFLDQVSLAYIASERELVALGIAPHEKGSEGWDNPS